jgi:hypothetical protein
LPVFRVLKANNRRYLTEKHGKTGVPAKARFCGVEAGGKLADRWMF